MAATQALLSDLEAMSFDPALEGCCRRDVAAQVRSGRAKLALQGADRAAARGRLAAAAIARDPSALAAALAESRLPPTAAAACSSGEEGEGGGHAGPGPRSARADARARPTERRRGGGDFGRSSSGGSDSEGGDAELASLRAARLVQLRAAAAAAEGGREAGFGRLNDVAPGKLLVGSTMGQGAAA
jgi:hypothetical protein